MYWTKAQQLQESRKVIQIFIGYIDYRLVGKVIIGTSREED